MIIWYLNHYGKAPSHGSWGRPYFLARGLGQLGHEALVVAASSHHARSEPVPPEEVDRVLRLDEVTFLFLPTRPYRGNGLGRFRNMMDFVRGIDGLAARVTKGALPRPDVIIASCAHLFVYPPALRLAQRLGSKLIFEVRDLWPMSLVEIGGIPAWSPLVWWMERIERTAYRTADAVVSLLPNALVHMGPRGLSEERFHWIPNGVWSAEWEEGPASLPEEHRKAIERCRRQGKLLVVYAGAHGPPNALDQVLDLQHVQCQGRPYHFLFVGDGVSKTALHDRAESEGNDFITFLPRTSKAAARSVIREADACFIGWQDKPIYQFGVSANKLYEYLMAGKPVLHAFGGEGDPIQNARAGITVRPYSPEELDAALRAIAAMSVAERESMGRRGREYVLREHDWSVLGRRYARVCQGLIGGHSRSADVRRVP